LLLIAVALLRPRPANPNSYPADAIGPKMARLGREHHRLLGNAYCIPPAELDCAARVDLRERRLLPDQHRVPPTLQAQHDYAERHGQPHQADLFQRLLNGLDRQAS
jgi:hypothetical protein